MVGRRAISESERVVRVRIGWFVEGEIVVRVSGDILCVEKLAARTCLREVLGEIINGSMLALVKLSPHTH